MKLSLKIIICVISLQFLGTPAFGIDHSKLHKISAQATKPKEIKSFYDLSKNYKSIHYWTWQKIVKADKSRLNDKILIEFVVGPNSSYYSKKTTSAIELTQRIFRSGLKPTKIWWITNTNDDDAWAENKMKELGKSRYFDGNNGYLINDLGEIIVNKKIDDKFKNDPNISNGSSDAHGYVHALQTVQFMNSKFNQSETPRWLFEGSADVPMMYFLYQSNYKKWSENRKGVTLKKFSKKFFYDYLDFKEPTQRNVGENPWAVTNQWPDQLAYDIGSYVCDIFIAIKGPESIMNLYEDVARTGNFIESFNNIFGISWSNARPLIADALFKISR